MKALWLEKIGNPVQVQEVSDPALCDGGVIVKLLAAPIMSFMGRVLSGDLPYYFLPTPFIPGSNGVGVIESVAQDVIGLRPGDLVFLNPHTKSRTTTTSSDDILIGLTAIGPESSQLQLKWRNGTFAEKVLWPAENLTVLHGFTSPDATLLAALSLAAIPYGGLLKGQLKPGQTLVVSGATGVLGSAAILTGLAMGAGTIVAVGRDEKILTKLQDIDPRIKAAKLQGNVDQDAKMIKGLAGSADLVLDILGNAPSADSTLAAIHALRHGGTAVLMGGVSAPVVLPYMHIMLNEITITGRFMYPDSAPLELARMARAGVLRLDAITPVLFTLEEFQNAFDAAGQTKGLSCPMFAF